MKYKILLFLIVGLGNVAMCQDEIITKKGDTINCKITRVSDQFIHYIIPQQSIRTRIVLSEVLSYTQKEEEPAEPEIVSDEPIDISKPIFNDLDDPPRLRVALNIGYTHQFGGYETHPPEYAKKLRSFLNLGSEIQFFPWENFGFGVKFNRTSLAAKQEFNPPLGLAGSPVNSIDEKVRFTYFALNVSTRRNVADDQYIYYGLSGGLVKYEDFGTTNGNAPFVEEGQSFGLNLEIGYDYIMSESLAVGFNIGLNIARIDRITNNGSTASGQGFDVSRFDVTVGVRYLSY